MVELVDTLDLGSSAARRGGSTPFIRTKPLRNERFFVSREEKFILSASKELPELVLHYLQYPHKNLSILRGFFVSREEKFILSPSK